MAEWALGGSQFSILLRSSNFGFQACATPLRALRLQQSSSSNINYQGFVVPSGNQKCPSANQKWHFKPLGAAAVVSYDSKESTIVTDNVDLATEGIEVERYTGGGGDDYGDKGGRGGGGGGGGGDGGDNSGDRKDEGEGGSSDDSINKKKMALSMSQKLTLGYAVLVAMGGLMGFLKSGSHKSLLAGGLSASILYHVYTQLPTNPVYASSIGFGVSAALLAVMGSRFMSSKKIFPAGVVSLVSLVMTGGYLHGVLRSIH